MSGGAAVAIGLGGLATVGLVVGLVFALRPAPAPVPLPQVPRPATPGQGGQQDWAGMIAGIGNAVSSVVGAFA